MNDIHQRTIQFNTQDHKELHLVKDLNSTIIGLSTYWILLFNSLMLFCTGCSQNYKYAMNNTRDPALNDRSFSKSVINQNKQFYDALDLLEQGPKNFMSNIKTKQQNSG